MMYIFEIPEIEQIIFSYLDYCVDFNILKRISKNYLNMIDNNKIFINFNNFGDLKVFSLQDKFVKACEISIFIVKYLFYKYAIFDIHYNNERAFRRSCRHGHLDIAQWLWSLDGKIDLHVYDDAAFRSSCLYGHLDVASWLWNLDGKISIHTRIDYLLKRWLWKLDNEIDENIMNQDFFYQSYQVNCLEWACLQWEEEGKLDSDVDKENMKLCINKWLESID